MMYEEQKIEIGNGRNVGFLRRSAFDPRTNRMCVSEEDKSLQTFPTVL
jgi:hypothetical protein